MDFISLLWSALGLVFWPYIVSGISGFAIGLRLYQLTKGSNEPAVLQKGRYKRVINANHKTLDQGEVESILRHRRQYSDIPGAIFGVIGLSFWWLTGLDWIGLFFLGIGAGSRIPR